MSNRTQFHFLCMVACIVMCLALLMSCTSTWSRALSMGDASVDDYRVFPSRLIAKSDTVRVLTRSLDTNIESKLKLSLGIKDIATFIKDTETQALLVIKGNAIVFSAYGDGYSENSIVTSFSVSKSFISAMFARLVAEQKVKLDQPITDFIPELLQRDIRFGNITVRNLLTMSSGLEYKPLPNLRADDVETYFNPDLRKAALERTIVTTPPNLYFHYNNYNPLLLGLIIERASGVSVSKWLETSIWQAMGAEFDASWSLDSTEHSFEKMESGLNATAKDFARFGCLFRDNGLVNGQQVVPKEWIKETVTKTSSSNELNYYNDSFGLKIRNAENGGYYSHFWYGLYCKDAARDDFFAAGNKSQIIYISPSTDLVIVRFGKRDGIDFWKWIAAFYQLAHRL